MPILERARGAPPARPRRARPRRLQLAAGHHARHGACRSGGRAVPGRERPHRLARAQPRAGRPAHRRRSEPGRPRAPPRARAGGLRHARWSSAIASSSSRTGRPPTRRCSPRSPRRATASTWRPTSSRTTRSAAQFADALIAKQAAGVQVNLIYDGVGALRHAEGVLRAPRRAGVNVLEFNPVNPLAAKAGWDVNQRDHRKLLVVDGRTRRPRRHQHQQRLFERPGPRLGASGGSAAAATRRRTCPGATPTCRSKARWSRRCRSCSWTPGTARRAPRWRRATTSRR